MKNNNKNNNNVLEYMQLIHDLCIEYSGLPTVSGLSELINEIRWISSKALKESSVSDNIEN